MNRFIYRRSEAIVTGVFLVGRRMATAVDPPVLFLVDVDSFDLMILVWEWNMEAMGERQLTLTDRAHIASPPCSISSARPNGTFQGSRFTLNANCWISFRVVAYTFRIFPWQCVWCNHWLILVFCLFDELCGSCSNS